MAVGLRGISKDRLPLTRSGQNLNNLLGRRECSARILPTRKDSRAKKLRPQQVLRDSPLSVPTEHLTHTFAQVLDVELLGDRRRKFLSRPSSLLEFDFRLPHHKRLEVGSKHYLDVIGFVRPPECALPREL